MAVAWNRGPDAPPMIADRHLYLDKAQTTIVEEGDERSAYQFIGKGHTIAPADIARLGLVVEHGRVVQRGTAPVSEVPPVEPPAEPSKKPAAKGSAKTSVKKPSEE